MRILASSIAVTATALALLLPAGHAQTLQESSDSSAMVMVRGLEVPPVRRDDPTALIDAGVIECDGYNYLVLNLAGEVKGEIRSGGSVGAILIPDVNPYDRAFQELRLVPAAVELDAALAPGKSPYFVARQKRFEVGFSRYRVLLYNETSSAVTVVFSAYRARF
jgi:hypothetical protein